MIRINLLPYRAARSKENIRKQISIFLLSFVLLIGVLVVFNSILGSKEEKLSSKLVNVKKEVAIYKEEARQVEKIKKMLELLNKQIGVVNQLKEYREKPPKLLAKMTEMVIPGRMQLTRLIYDDANLTLNGFALDNETVADFMLRLERSGLFSSVVLASLQQSSYDKIIIKQFNITCKKVVPKKEVPASK
ncbi:MAG: pilus assembly protein PilN [Deltaproteobacteria bacterium]|nr:MAG: pilus assembly protein PilN [Deltaproteobacteria bacterium]